MKVWSKDKVMPEDMEDFLSGKDLKLDERLVKYDATVCLAYAEMLRNIGILEGKEFECIKETLEKIKEEGLKLSKELEDVHSNMEFYLVEKCGDAGKKLHIGKSRNDQISTGMLLYMKDEIGDICFALEKLCKSILRIARKAKFPMPGYTHMQRAMPSTFSHLLLSYCENLMNDLEFLKKAGECIDKCPLGSAAGYGSILMMDRKFLAQRLGFSGVHINSISAVESRGKNEFMIGSALCLIGLDLSRMAEDLVLFSTKEFGFVSLEGTGSSMMPQKKNPDVAEIVRARSSKLIGELVSIFTIMKGLPSGYNRDSQETKGSIMNMFKDLKECINAMRMLVEGMRINKDALMNACEKDMLMADEATLRALSGKPFRETYFDVKEGNETSLSLDESIRMKRSVGHPGDEEQIMALEKRLHSIVHSS